MGNQFFFSLDTVRPLYAYKDGSITHVTNKEVPGFVNISFASLKLAKKAYLEPIWHPNANKIGYCLQGEALVTIRTPSDADCFVINKGDIFFVPQGYIHHVVNTGDEECHIHFAFNHVQPETMCLSRAVQSISNEVFNSTFETSSGFVDGFNYSDSPQLIKTLPSLTELPAENTNAYKFNIAASNKPIQTKGGYLQLGTKTTLPILDGLGILGFGLNPNGIVEPHWHTNAVELVYIVKGKTLITVLSPDGSVEHMHVNAGQGAFAPASYFHNIENIGSEDVEVIAYFSNAAPDYIGIGEVVGSFSTQLLSSIFNVPESYFDQFKKPSAPLVIVPL